MSLRNAFGLLALDTTVAAIGKRLSERILVGNARKIFRDGFANSDVVQPNPANWEVIATPGAGHIIEQGGDSGAATFLRVSLSPFDESTGVRILSNETFQFPFRIGFGVSLSQRAVGQEFFVGAAAVDPTSTATPRAIAYDPDVADVPITANVVVASSVATITAPLHGLKGNDRVLIANAADHRLNVGPVAVTVVDRNTISIPLSLSNGTYTAGPAVVRYLDLARMARNAAGIAFDNTNSAQGLYVTKRNGSRQRYALQTLAATDAVRVSTSPYTDPFVAGSVYETALGYDEVQFRTYVADSNNGVSSAGKWSQGIPDETLEYRLMVRARNLGRLTRPVARISSIAKTGTTTATITTDTAHGLATGDLVQLLGMRDQTNFPNASTAVTVTVTGANTFTATVGSAVTATSANGAVILLEGSTNLQGATNTVAQSITASDGILTVIGNTAWTFTTPGETVNLYGLDPSVAAYEGAYRILRTNGTTIELTPIGATPAPATIASTATGGTIIRRTDLRIHFVRVLDHHRHVVEVSGGRGNGSDQNNSVPVTVAQMPTINVNPVTLSLSGETTESAAALAANGTYTGTARDLGQSVGPRSTRVRPMVTHLAGLTSGILVFEESADATTFRETWRQVIPSDGMPHTFENVARQRYYRYRFLNGAVAQTAFYLHTRLANGEGPVDLAKVLTIPLANTALAAVATTQFILDLGANHAWGSIRAAAASDQASASSGFAVQWSDDNSLYRQIPGDTSAVTAGSAALIDAKVQARYCKIIYVNGSTAQGTFRLAATMVTL